MGTVQSSVRTMQLATRSPAGSPLTRDERIRVQLRRRRVACQGSQPNRRCAAFTLVELIASIAVTAVIGSMAAGLVLEASRLRSSASVRAELTDDAARAVEQMLRYVRLIRQDAGLTGQAQIGAAESQRLAFDTYGLRQSGTTLEMSIDTDATWQPMARNVDALTIRYYSAGGAELSPAPLSAANRAAVRQVGIQLRLARGSESVLVRTRVYLRNFMNEAG